VGAALSLGYCTKSYFTFMKTAAVTIGMGKDFYEMATWTGGLVEELLGLEVRILDDRYHHLGVKEKDHDFMQKASTVKFSVFDIYPDLERVVFFDADWRPVRRFNIFDYCPDPDKMYVTVEKPYSEELKYLETFLELQPETYFNGGFFVVSRNFKKYFEVAKRDFGNYKEKYFDQCILNQVLKGKVTYADSRLNVKVLKNYDPNALFNNSEILGYHHGNNYHILKGWLPEYDWN